MILKSYLTRNRPVSIVHFITNRCNARCKHCFIDFDDEDVFKDDLTLDETKKFIRNLNTSLKNVNLTGGEPFLRQDLYEIIQEYFNSTSVESVYMTTNGFFVDKMIKLANNFINDKRYNGKKIIYSISLDNFPEKHDENRRIKGLFDKAIEAYNKLKALNNKKIITNVNLCVTPENCDDIEKIFKYLTEEKNIKSVTSIIIRGKELDPETRKKIYASYVKLNSLIDSGLGSKKLEGYGKTFFGKVLNAKNVILHDEVAKTFLTNEYITPCYAGGLFGVVCANGDVYPCEILSLKMGNLRDYDYDLNKIFDSHAAKTTRKFIRETNCHCTYECAWSINILMNPKYAFKILTNLQALNSTSNNHKLERTNININELKIPSAGTYDTTTQKAVSDEYQKFLNVHPTIKVDPNDNTHSVADKRTKIEKLIKIKR